MSEADRELSAHDDGGVAAYALRVIIHPVDGLTVRLSRRAGHVYATVSGEIDFTAAEIFEHVLIDHLLRETDSLSLELSGVAFFDCAGLNALLRARGVAERTGAVLELTAVSPPVRRVLGLTGTDRIFDYAEDDGSPPSDLDPPPETIRAGCERPLCVRAVRRGRRSSDSGGKAFGSGEEGSRSFCPRRPSGVSTSPDAPSISSLPDPHGARSGGRSRGSPTSVTRAGDVIARMARPHPRGWGHARTPARVVHHRVDDMGDYVGADPGVRLVGGRSGDRAQGHGRAAAR